MTFDIEVVLRARKDAVIDRIAHRTPPHAWAEDDVEAVLKHMLMAIDRARDPDGAADRYVALRGFSWIVEPSGAGVVIAIEIPMGCAVAGPFEIAQPRLDAMVRRVIAAAAAPGPTVH